MVTDVNWTHYGDHSAIYTNIELLLYTWNQYNVMSIILQLKKNLDEEIKPNLFKMETNK